MSRKSARKARFAKNNPELVGKEKKEKEGTSATTEESTPSSKGMDGSFESDMGEELKEVQQPDSSTPEETIDPNDVDGDGDVDADDVAAVANAAADAAKEEE